VLYCIFPILIAIPLILAALMVVGFTIWGFARKKWPVAFGGLSLLLLAALWIAAVAVNIQRASVYKATRNGMEAVAWALRSYHEKNGSFPKGLRVGDLGNPQLPAPDSGHGYVLNLSEHSFLLTSWGRDGKPGGKGLDQDILVSWKAGDDQIGIQASPDYP
jgi:hypothetical protein